MMHAVQPPAAEIKPAPKPMVHALPVAASRRIAALEAAVRAGDSPAETEFWREVKLLGAPLIEMNEDDPGYCVVTFVWRETSAEPIQQVAVIIHTLTDRTRDDLSLSLLQPIPGTAVWHLSYRLRADLRASYQLFVVGQADAPLEPVAFRDRPAWRYVLHNAIPDPANPRAFAARLSGPRGSVLELPQAPLQPWWQPRPAAPAGQLSEQTLESAALGNARRFWFYTPPHFTPEAAEYPLLVLLDGDVWATGLDVATTLDNLINAGLLPPLIAVMPDAVEGDARAREMTCNPAFVSFLRDELLPAVGALCPITSRPERTLIAGQSMGGLMSLFAGWTAADRFGAALVQSGSLWWRDGWLTEQIDANARRSLRVYLEVGLQEWALREESRALRDVLARRGYDLTYREFNGGHDYLCWRGSLVDGLLALCHDWL